MRLSSIVSLVAVAAASLALSPTADASPGAYACDRTAQERAAAKTVVVAKATRVSTVEKDGTRYVRVSYTAANRTVVVVEDTCKVGAPSFEELGYPGVARYCDVGAFHAIPGLDDKGQPNGASVTLPLVGAKSALDGRNVQRLVRISPWTPCLKP